MKQAGRMVLVFAVGSHQHKEEHKRQHLVADDNLEGALLENNGEGLPLARLRQALSSAKAMR